MRAPSPASWISSRPLAWLVVGLALSGPAPTSAQGPFPEEAKLRSHVETLASPEFEGRRNAGARRAEMYVVEAFHEIGLRPLFDGRFTQNIVGQDGLAYGRNVGGVIPATGEGRVDEVILLGAHYDHLGKKGDKLFPGADDNASGVAMLIEVARAIKASAPGQRRDILFVAFDLEEDGLWGSRYFVDHPPVPIDKIALNLTADMIGRSLGGVCDPYVFVLGSESAPRLRGWIEAATPAEGVKVGLLGADLLGIPRSDYGPFKSRKVPYLFFSTGENPCYHAPEDIAATLDYPKLRAISGLITGIVRTAAAADEVPRWNEPPDHAASEPQLLKDVLETLLANRERLKLGPTKIALMRSTLKTIDDAIARGSMNEAERTRLVRAAQIILISVL